MRASRAPGFIGLSSGIGCCSTFPDQLGVADESLAQRLIFVGLRRQRVQPFADVAVLKRLLQPGAHVRLRARDSIDLVQLLRVGIAVRQRRGVFQRRLCQALSGLSALQEQVGLQPVRGRPCNGVADLLLRLLVERHSRGRGATRSRRTGWNCLAHGAGGQDGGAQGKAKGRADPFAFSHRRLNAATRGKGCMVVSSSPHRCAMGGAQSSCMFGSRRPSPMAARARSASTLVTG